MAAYAGSSLVIIWTRSIGTNTLTGDHRNFTLSPTADLYDQTAGADTAHTFIPGPTNGQCSYSAVLQAGSSNNVAFRMNAGDEGTLKVYPEGSVTGNIMLTIPAICTGSSWTIPYNDIVSVDAAFQVNGAISVGTAA